MENNSIVDIMEMDVKSIDVLGIGPKEEEMLVDYCELGIVDTDVQRKLDRFAKEMQFNYNQSTKHLLAFAQKLKESQLVLKEYGKGTFVKWFTALGLEKNFVYRLLDKFNLYLVSKNEKVMEAPATIVNYFKKENDASKIKVLNKILESDKPSVALKIYKEENPKKREIPNEEMIERLHKRYSDLEMKIDELRKEQLSILEQIENLKHD